MSILNLKKFTQIGLKLLDTQFFITDRSRVRAPEAPPHVETAPYGITFALQKLTPCGAVSPFPQKGTLRSPVRLRGALTTAYCRYHLFAGGYGFGL